MITEAAGRPSSAGWFTSSRSNGTKACVQVRFVGGDVQVADSKDHGRGPVITVSGAQWDAFVAASLGMPTPTGALSAAPTPDGGRLLTGPDGTTLRYTAAEWRAFIAGAVDGEFRRPMAGARP